MSNRHISRTTRQAPQATSLILRFGRVPAVIILVAFLATLIVAASLAESLRALSSGVIGSASSSTAPTGPKNIANVARSKAVNDRLRAALSLGEPGLVAAFLPQAPGGEQISTYAADCTTPQTSFILGEVACAKYSGGPSLSIIPRKIVWVDTDNNILRSVDVTSDPQTDLFTIPLVSTSTDYRGIWRVNDISAAGSRVRASAFFSVSNPALPAADLSVFKSNDSDGTITAGSNISYDLFFANKGPDNASNVVITDDTPANTTFLSGVSDNPDLNCTFPAANSSGGTTNCTLASLAAGASFKLTLVFNVTTGTAAGSTISNTGNISSDTMDPRAASNSATSNTTVVAGAAGATCTLDCPENVNANANTTEGGQRGAHVTFDAATATGDCGAVTASPASGSFFPVGTTQVNVSSETGGGSCSFTVTVTDSGTNGPTITCPANKDINTAPNDTHCEATVDPGSPTTTGDNVTVEGSRSDGLPLTDPYPVGTTTITWTATAHDGDGNPSGTATCQQTIVVHDKTAPALSCPTDVSVASPTGSCGATVNVGVATATDNCDGPVTPVPSRSDNKPITDPFPVGTVTITWTATDSSGNSSSCAQTVVVLDNEPPTITCPSDVTTNTDPGTCSASNVNHGTATATDNCTAVTVSGTRSDGQALDAPYPKGTTTITWTATDASGNHSSCTQRVTVNDTEKPVVSCPAPTSASADANCMAPIPNVVPNVTSSDNCGSVTVTQSPAPGTMVGLGSHTITVTGTDGSGNSSSCTTTFTVNDTTPPVITLNGQTPSMWPPNHKYQTFQVTNFVTSINDNCSGSIPVSSVVITKVTSDELENGGGGDGNTLNDIVISSDCKSVQLRAERDSGGDGRVYTIFFSVMDSHGNTGTATAKVVVQRNPGEAAVDSGPHYTVMSSCP